MGATPGIVSILHTNGQDLTFHPHVHSIVRGGGINAVGKWIKEKRANGSFLCPRRAMEKIFKGFFLDHLRKYILDKTLVYSNLEELESVLEMVGQISGMYMPKLRLVVPHRSSNTWDVIRTTCPVLASGRWQSL